MSEVNVAPRSTLHRVPVICNTCDWRYLVPATSTLAACPHCASTALEVLQTDEAGLIADVVPELVVPFRVGADTVGRQVAAFAEGIPFPPEDLTPGLLVGRMQRVLLPVWLADADAASNWRAEVGFDYEVVSHRERYADGAGWSTSEVQEGRVRWEPRLGRLVRHYDNVAAPALASHGLLKTLLGAYDLRAAVDAGNASLGEMLIRAPDREPTAAWEDALVVLRDRAQEECREAAGADHVRDYRWSPAFDNANWTLMLLPLYLTNYRDDEGGVQRVLVNGQTGTLHGAKRGSPQRAQRRALWIGGIALAVFVLSLVVALLGLIVPPLLIVGILGGVVAVLIGAGAFVPIGRVALFNREQKREAVGV